MEGPESPKTRDSGVGSVLIKEESQDTKRVRTPTAPKKGRVQIDMWELDLTL